VGVAEHLVHGMNKLGGSAETRMVNAIVLEERTIQEFCAHLKQIMGIRRTPAHLLFLAESMIH
jgi:hypothetical protein